MIFFMLYILLPYHTNMVILIHFYITFCIYMVMHPKNAYIKIIYLPYIILYIIYLIYNHNVNLYQLSNIKIPYNINILRIKHSNFYGQEQNTVKIKYIIYKIPTFVIRIISITSIHFMIFAILKYVFGLEYIITKILTLYIIPFTNQYTNYSIIIVLSLALQIFGRAMITLNRILESFKLRFSTSQNPNNIINIYYKVLKSYYVAIYYDINNISYILWNKTVSDKNFYL
uniref:Uncharacterized protein n=1 Tax=Bornetia secundiflora TaxID=2575637 RepID=A0A4D6WMM5_9FLOR|nr:hypothetical protein [Bornetia secundiflora]